MVKFGIQQPFFLFPQRPLPGQQPATGHAIYENVRRIAQQADRLGFDSFWLMDHFIQIPSVGDASEPILEPWILLSSLAASTTRIKLGTMVTGMPYRNPALLAKMGATLDVISGGRLFMGIGAAWHEREFQAYGWTFPPRGERLRRLEEAVQVITKLWTEDSPSFHGRYYSLKNAVCQPRPVQKPRPPILVGGGGEQVTLRLAAKYADACNIFGDPATVRHTMEVLSRHCERLGRDPATMVKSRLGRILIAKDERELTGKLARYVPPNQRHDLDSWQVIAGTPEQCIERCSQLLDAGVDYLIFSFPDADTLEPLQLFAEEVMPALTRG